MPPRGPGGGRAARGGRRGFRDPAGTRRPEQGRHRPEPSARGARRSVGAGSSPLTRPAADEAEMPRPGRWRRNWVLGAGGEAHTGTRTGARGQQEAGGSELGSSGRKARQVPPVGTRASSGPDALTPRDPVTKVHAWPGATLAGAAEETPSWCRRSGRWLCLLCHVNVCPPSRIQAQRPQPQKCSGASPPPGTGICFPKSPHLTDRAEHRPPCQPPSWVVEGAG